MVYVDANNIKYRDLDTATDTLGTETTVFTGVSSAGGGALSVVTGRDGRIAVAGSIDAGAEDGAWSSTDDGATWGDTIADPSEGATQDQYLLLPGWNSDTADIMLIFWDASANGVSVKRYDDSANTWTETAVITDGNATDLVATTAYPNFSAFVDVTNSRNVVAIWNATDAVNADLKCYIIDDTNVTAVTDIVLNSTDDQGLCAIGIDTATSTWYGFYCGKTDGSETFTSSMKVYYKTSTDAGTTWGSETALSNTLRNLLSLSCTPRFTSSFLVTAYHNLSGQNEYITSAFLPAAGISSSLMISQGVKRSNL
jgi:hypothetical protein